MRKHMYIEPENINEYYFSSLNYYDYNNSEIKLIKDITTELQKKGIPTWYEHHNTFADRETFLYRKMLDSLGFFMFVSKTLMRKDESYARYELSLAKHLNKEIYVILLDDIRFEKISFSLKGVYLDLMDPKKSVIVPFTQKNYPQKAADFIANRMHFFA